MAPREGVSVLTGTLHLHMHFLHHLKGATVDYVALALTACLSWIIGIGPGEPALVASGVFAAKHKLDISPVLFWAWIGAATGGVIGWLAGKIAGRKVLTAPGPLRTLRIHAVRRGEDVFKRKEIVAIVMTPPWVAGVNRSDAAVFLPTNVISALVLWALPIGLGAYFIGPPILDLANDAGLILTIFLVLVVGAIVTAEVFRRRRRGKAGGQLAQPDTPASE